ncbi:MAG: hypothetical protein KatS3mg118_1523 [Paracoccaceae bacterium]|nr:MAG: hypothetical protein KatS3mg118_1523 [Paracoccaceae bacterium]
MIVLPRQRLVFPRIRKNTGAWLRGFLRRPGEETHSREWNGRSFRGNVNWRELIAGAPDLAGFEAFVISRNPWSRLVSAFEWWKSKPETRHGITRANVAFLSDFPAFVTALARTAGLAASDPAVARQVAKLEAESKVRLQPELACYASQWSYIIDDAGKVRARHLPIESLSEALPAYLSERLGRPVTWREINRNRNAKADWRSCYSDADAETVGRLFADDIRHFGYRFDP